MELMSIDEIKQGLDDYEWPPDLDFDDIRLKEPGLGSAEIERCEEGLTVRFPPDFRRFIARFDVGSLTIGAVSFCHTGDVVREVTDKNTRDPLGCAWWGNGERPPSLLMIAGTDPYTIVLDTGSNEVHSLDPELGISEMRVIASDFDLFLRGIGTVFLRRVNDRLDDPLSASIHERVGSQHLQFWRVIT